MATIRISRDLCNMQLAYVISQRGTCSRAQVGCVITRDGRIISTGYNGAVGGAERCNCTPDRKCTDSVHAEANAIAFAARRGIPLEGGYLYCTHAPCFDCAKLIIQAGISQVFYNIEYLTDPGIPLLESWGIPVYNVELEWPHIA